MMVDYPYLNKEPFLVAAATFYIDDSGPRHPDHKPTLARHGNDWFALGGVLIDDDQKEIAESLIDTFRASWPLLGDNPFHSSEIRGCHGNFAWLGKDAETKALFLRQLEALLLALPVTGLACVIDRPGYNKRYAEKYGRDRWMLCKTAFSIVVERAVKYSQLRDRKLRVYLERCNKTDDAIVQSYYNALKEGGNCFDVGTSAKYEPATNVDYRKTLYEFRTKAKSSRLMQIADLYLWPICMGGYQRDNAPYRRLVEAGKLIEWNLSADEAPVLGSKYSCFDQI